MIKRLFGCCASLGFIGVLVLVWRYIRSTWSSVMSRVSNGVGHWVSLAIDLSWRRTQGHHGESRHQAVDACASDLHSGTARRRRGSGSEVCLCEMESERVVSGPLVRESSPAILGCRRVPRHPVVWSLSPHQSHTWRQWWVTSHP